MKTTKMVSKMESFFTDPWKIMSLILMTVVIGICVTILTSGVNLHNDYDERITRIEKQKLDISALPEALENHRNWILPHKHWKGKVILK